MSFDTDWDIDQYKTEHESEEHWLLRRSFMETHKDKFPEDDLVCLAQVFVNVEFMGCKYPEETMRLVGELSQEVAKDYRNSKLTRLKRTFVKASDAAEARAKEYTKSHKNSLFKSFSQKHDNNDHHSNQLSTFKSKKLKVDLFSDLPFDKFVLYDTGDRNSIRMSGQKCSINVEEKETIENGHKKIIIYIGGKIAGCGLSTNLKEAKLLSFEDALKNLKNNCYTIKPKLNSDRINISKDDEKVYCNLKTTEIINREEGKIDSSNIGFKIMQKFGWSGGGLGSKTQGIENPVDFLIKNNRHGLGVKDDVINRDYFRKILTNYVKSDDIRDLYFESSFTKEERTLLHQLVSETNLKSTSHGKEQNRFLVVSKKTITPYQILDEILINKNEMYINKYEVHVPKQKKNLFPQHFENEKLTE